MTEKQTTETHDERARRAQGLSPKILQMMESEGLTKDADMFSLVLAITLGGVAMSTTKPVRFLMHTVAAASAMVEDGPPASIGKAN